MNDPFHVAVDRSEQFKRELTLADPVQRRQLLAAWKEAIIEQFLKAVQSTDDPRKLGCLDTNAGLILSNSESETELRLRKSREDQRAAANPGSTPSAAPRV